MIIHTVLSGETLEQIASFYGVPSSVLTDINGIRNPQSLVVGQTVIIPQNSPKIGRIATNGYAYTTINRDVLRRSLPRLTYLSIFSYSLSADGSISTLDDEELINEAVNFNAVPLMVVTAMDYNGNFSGDTAARIMTDPLLSEIATDNIARTLYAKGYGGVDLDFEFIPLSGGSIYADFVNLLRSKIAPSPVFVALAPKTYAAQPGLLYEAHDYPSIGAAADKVLLMTYEWGYAYGQPQAVAPIGNVSRVLNYALSEIPAQKIMLGYPNYGYDWTLPYRQGTRAVTIGNEEAIAIAQRYGAEIQYSDQSASPYFYYTDENGRSHVVWFEDARSTRAKCELIASNSLYGMGVWNIMRYFAQLWTVLSQLFDIIKLT